LSKAVAKLASITFSRIVCSSPDRHNLDFLTEGKSCYYIHHTSLLGFPTGWSSTTHQSTSKTRTSSFRRVSLFQGFFSRLIFFTGGHRNYRLLRNLKNLGNLPTELI
jgi:hypothetical protein